MGVWDIDERIILHERNIMSHERNLFRLYELVIRSYEIIFRCYEIFFSSASFSPNIRDHSYMYLSCKY